MGKSENYLIFGNHCSFGSQCCLKHLAKLVMKLSEYQREGHSLALIKGHSDFNVKTCFLQNQSGDLEPKFV